MFRARDQAKHYVAFGAFNAIFIAVATIVRVVILNQEAPGWVQAQLEGAIVVALISFVVLLRKVKPSFKWGTLKSALIFSIPLMPHFVAHWILSVSDRMILESYVGLAQLGLYSLGYQFGQGFQVIVTGINNAMIPLFGRASREKSERLKLPDVITYYLFIVITLALILALIGGEIVLLLFPSNYDGAVPVVPWIILGFLAFAVYLIPMNYLSMTRGETKYIPLSTLTAALLNLVLNLVFIPKFGIMAAAVNTAVGYGILALIMLIIALQSETPPIQYGRIAKLSLCSILVYIIGQFLLRSNPLTNISIGVGLTLSIPFLLVPLGFWSHREIQQIRRAPGQLVDRILGAKG
jgi:O-antigen/teichoic acid export membrane protein